MNFFFKSTDYLNLYNPYLLFIFTAKQVVVLNGLKTVRQALVYQAESFAGRPDFYSFQKVIADGKTLAFNSYSPLWRIQKKILVNGIKLFSQKVST